MSARHAFVRPATAGDLSAVRVLLQQCGLPANDLSRLENLLVAETGDQQVIGVVGLDRTGARGFLRSLAVAAPWRGSGLDERLVAHCETAALIAGVSEVYLLATTADDFFHHLGYQALAHATVPAEINEIKDIAAQIQSGTPSPPSARWFGKRL